VRQRAKVNEDRLQGLGRICGPMAERLLKAHLLSGGSDGALHRVAKRYSMVFLYFSPGRSTVEGKAGLLGESG